ncbi:DNA (cytosine-5)-methyltransferase 1 [Actinoalloteichus hoggarensis]|uniref:Modification methylase AplI n=1 Tax=Actinoalloteichus hoggarensis TaxID=1470176 RepID=A0A221W8G9_9PSEU|nr:DNA cytosine methyltransferase [Actinoalloteichus hoggarensis]ASO22054.1 Modification methylase AplI [Actinoalloteichus hoggarensis]MBB5923864.1 DNA (cytosine-5)-methyltransferase 1 [Actinoalloteichus hoggarensis]
MSKTAVASGVLSADPPKLPVIGDTATRLTSVELFAGAGGLALGCQMAGFESLATVERDKWACDTVRQNKHRGHELVANWNVHECDVRKFEWSKVTEDVTLVAGGPPCQPFSTGGLAKASDDPRDMFPVTAEIISGLAPQAFIIENVRGLTRTAFSDYYEYIQHRLALPRLTSNPGEKWFDHLERLRAAIGDRQHHELNYRVVPTLVNAADYGVPQQRHRVFIVGFRGDLDIEWSFPATSHSKHALLHSQWVTGDYWEEHEVPSSKRPEQPKQRIPEYLITDEPQQRWRTVRDAFAGLPEPMVRPSRKVLNHEFQPGARSYPGHTGSPLDMPAKALKAGGHGVPGGENMLRNVDGSIRYFTVRESARLQTFPDDYELHGSWGEAMRQLGNAVPVLLGQVVAESVYKALIREGIKP